MESKKIFPLIQRPNILDCYDNTIEGDYKLCLLALKNSEDLVENIEEEIESLLTSISTLKDELEELNNTVDILERKERIAKELYTTYRLPENKVKEILNILKR